MNHRLLAELERSRHQWWQTWWDDSDRLRGYQRQLAECRRLSPRPRASVALALRQCKAARRTQQHAVSALMSCNLKINNLMAQPNR